MSQEKRIQLDLLVTKIKRHRDLLGKPPKKKSPVWWAFWRPKTDTVRRTPDRCDLAHKINLAGEVASFLKWQIEFSHDAAGCRERLDLMDAINSALRVVNINEAHNAFEDGRELVDVLCRAVPLLEET